MTQPHRSTTDSGLVPLSDDEAALVYHVQRWGSTGYPVERVGSKWCWRDWRSVSGSPVLYKTKRAATTAFEGWVDLTLERWRAQKMAQPDAILTGVGVRILGGAS
jgi:hypothetical protein